MQHPCGAQRANRRASCCSLCLCAPRRSQAKQADAQCSPTYKPCDILFIHHGQRITAILLGAHAKEVFVAFYRFTRAVQPLSLFCFGI